MDAATAAAVRLATRELVALVSVMVAELVAGGVGAIPPSPPPPRPPAAKQRQETCKQCTEENMKSQKTGAMYRVVQII